MDQTNSCYKWNFSKTIFMSKKYNTMLFREKHIKQLRKNVPVAVFRTASKQCFQLSFDLKRDPQLHHDILYICILYRNRGSITLYKNMLSTRIITAKKNIKYKGY